MAALSQQDTTDTPTTDSSEWGWNAVKNWWNSSSTTGCRNAEQGLLNAFIDADLFEYESRDIPIDYDAEPASVKQKRLERSQSFSFFSRASVARSDEPLTDSLPSPREFIHTLTIRAKPEKLSSINISEKNSAVNAHCDVANVDAKIDFDLSNDIDVDEEIKSDGRGIDGQSAQFYRRSVGQQGTSCYPTLKSQLSKLSHSQSKTCNLSCPPIILTHGYGAGGGMYIPCIPALLSSLHSSTTLNTESSPDIHIVDWLGNGMSSRPDFECTNTSEAEDWFVLSLEAWRRKMNIPRMVLVGHSLGGYAVCVYAMRFPQFVSHLVLVSPVGVPERPIQSAEAKKGYSWKVRTAMSAFGRLWDAGWTPHDVIRMSGPKGKALVQSLVQRRLFRLDDDSELKTLLAEYLYHIVAMKGSGEYALSKILQPGAWAYAPLVRRMGGLKSAGMKVDFVYGETDWMTSAHAVKLKKEGVVECEVYVNPECGHQLILEDSQGFGRLVGAIIAKGLMT